MPVNTVHPRILNMLVGAVLAAVALALTPAGASAAPTLTFKLKALPIPGVPGTGDILGAGAMIQGEGTVSGTEYGGFPPPLIGVEILAPAGTQLDTQGFATCAPTAVEQKGLSACSKRSFAGAQGTASGVVSFGGERVEESVSVQPFFAPGGGVDTFVDGSTPVSIEIVAKGRFVPPSPPFGVKFIGEVPLIETVPGAPDASFLKGTVYAGAAYRQGRKTISYITLPKTCAKGGWPVKVKLSFFGGATTEASNDIPCPKR